MRKQAAEEGVLNEESCNEECTRKGTSSFCVRQRLPGRQGARPGQVLIPHRNTAAALLHALLLLNRMLCCVPHSPTLTESHTHTHTDTHTQTHTDTHTDTHTHTCALQACTPHASTCSPGQKLQRRVWTPQFRVLPRAPTRSSTHASVHMAAAGTSIHQRMQAQQHSATQHALMQHAGISYQCGHSMWPFNVANQCGQSMWPFNVANQCGQSMWPINVAPKGCPTQRSTRTSL